VLRRQRQVVGRAADQLSLLFGAIEEPEAVLKAPAVSDFCPEFQRILGFLQLKFKLYNIADFNVAWKRGAEAALGNVLGPAMQRSRSLNDNTTVQGIPRMRSRQGPWMLFLLRHNPKPYHNVRKKQDLLGSYLPLSFWMAQRACSPRMGSASSSISFRSGRNSVFPLLPMAMTTFRRSPAYLARLIGDPRKTRR